MFIGRYYHTLEEKGRVSLPKKFRQAEASWVITRGLDGGLFLFPEKSFQKNLTELSNRTFTKKRDRDFIRYMTNDAYEVSADKNGRVLLPKYLTQFADLTKEVVIIGSFQYIEIWDVDKYHTYLDELEKNGETITEGIENAQASVTT